MPGLTAEPGSSGESRTQGRPRTSPALSKPAITLKLIRIECSSCAVSRTVLPADGQAGLIVGLFVRVKKSLDPVRLRHLVTEIVTCPRLGPDKKVVINVPYMSDAGVSGKDVRAIWLGEGLPKESHHEIGVELSHARAAEDNETAAAREPLRRQVEVIEVQLQIEGVKVDSRDRRIILERDCVGQVEPAQAPFEPELRTYAIAAPHVVNLRALLLFVLGPVQAGGNTEVALCLSGCRDDAQAETHPQQDPRRLHIHEALTCPGKVRFNLDAMIIAFYCGS